MKHGKVDANTAKGLLELKKRIEKANIPPSAKDKTINLATWNIRDFGKKPRLKQSIHYIAEMLSNFDLIAITELRKNLTDLKKVLDILGPHWDVVYSDYVADWGGNWERFAYVFDTRVVKFTGLAAEADAPRKKNQTTKEYVSQFDWWRKPYIASFSAGNFDFVLMSVHIRWGKNKSDRIKPLKLLAKWIDKRSRDIHGTDNDIILMGDFNIPKIDDDLYNAVTSKGLKAPEALLKLEHGSNLAKNKRYDQILHHPSFNKCFTDKGGIVDFYTGGVKKLYPNKELTKSAFTYQLSDHLPLWIQVDVDTEKEKLDQLIK